MSGLGQSAATLCWPRPLPSSAHINTSSHTRIAADTSEPFLVGLKTTRPISVFFKGLWAVTDYGHGHRLHVKLSDWLVSNPSNCLLCRGASRHSKYFHRALWVKIPSAWSVLSLIIKAKEGSLIKNCAIWLMDWFSEFETTPVFITFISYFPLKLSFPRAAPAKLHNWTGGDRTELFPLYFI